MAGETYGDYTLQRRSSDEAGLTDGFEDISDGKTVAVGDVTAATLFLETKGVIDVVVEFSPDDGSNWYEPAKESPVAFSEGGYRRSARRVQRNDSSNLGKEFGELDGREGAATGGGLTVGRMPASGNSKEEIQQLVRSTPVGPNPSYRARSFDEANVAHSGTNTGVVGGSIGFPPGSDRLKPYITNGSTVSEKRGFRFTAEVPAPGIEYRVAKAVNSWSSFDLALVEVSTGNTLATASPGSGGTWYELSANIEAGKQYDLLVNDSGDSYDCGVSSSSPPFSTSNVSIDAGVDIDGHTDSGQIYNLSGLSLLPVTATTSSGSVEFTDGVPQDIHEWDTATFTKTLNGGAVDVFVAYDDGSGWTRTNGGNPVDRNYSLQADDNIQPTHNVRLEYEMGRADTTEDPRLDSAYLTWLL